MDYMQEVLILFDWFASANVTHGHVLGVQNELRIVMLTQSVLGVVSAQITIAY